MPHTLSEADSKALLSTYGVPFAVERLVDSAEGGAAAAAELGFPVAAKLCGDAISHKSERGLVRLGLNSPADVAVAVQELLDAARPADAATGVLVAPMIQGSRELIAGLSHDEQFGPTVLLGIGGVLAEAVADVAIRLVPIQLVDAQEMIEQLDSQALLGEFRGAPPVDRDAVADVLMALSELAMTDRSVASVDLNPLIISDGRPIAVDALVEMVA